MIREAINDDVSEPAESGEPKALAEPSDDTVQDQGGTAGEAEGASCHEPGNATTNALTRPALRH